MVFIYNLKSFRLKIELEELIQRNSLKWVVIDDLKSFRFVIQLRIRFDSIESKSLKLILIDKFEIISIWSFIKNSIIRSNSIEKFVMSICRDNLTLSEYVFLWVYFFLTWIDFVGPYGSYQIDYQVQDLHVEAHGKYH